MALNTERVWQTLLYRGEAQGPTRGSRIDDYVVEDHADNVLGTFRTQHEAIVWSEARGHHPLVP